MVFKLPWSAKIGAFSLQKVQLIDILEVCDGQQEPPSTLLSVFDSIIYDTLAVNGDNIDIIFWKVNKLAHPLAIWLPIG